VSWKQNDIYEETRQKAELERWWPWWDDIDQGSAWQQQMMNEQREQEDGSES